VAGTGSWWGAVCGGLALLGGGCGGGGEQELSELAQRGRVTYVSLCIACHNADPNEDGSLGPAIAGASRALLEAKVLRGEYPPGYVPKRDSNAMPPFPHLAGEIDALHAYLAEVERK